MSTPGEQPQRLGAAPAHASNRESRAEYPLRRWQQILHTIIFESDTPAGKAFDSGLLALISLSVVTVLLESVPIIRQRHGELLFQLEWSFTLLFTVEYLLRLLCVRRPLRYATSFFGIVDLIALLPGYLSLIFPGAQYLLVVRMLRLLRVFRIFKLVAYVDAASYLRQAIAAGRHKISVFLLTVVTLVIIVGSLMYVIEGEDNGFTSIPRSIYWAVVTLTTVGYGDLAPRTPLGQALAVIVMLLGYGIIAVPTGIVTAELTRQRPRALSGQACPVCGRDGHDADAQFCKFCGASLA
jgi:voltage-gated potassium channel